MSLGPFRLHSTPFCPHIHSAAWLSRTLPPPTSTPNPQQLMSPYLSMPIHQSFHIKYHSGDTVPNPRADPTSALPIQITVFPGFFPWLTSTRSRRWWRNNTDTWSYSICALGRSPKSIIVSPVRAGGRGGRIEGRPECPGITQQRKDFPKIMSGRAEQSRETYLLPGPRLPCAELDVACNQLVSSCRQKAKSKKQQQQKKIVLASTKKK